MIGTVLGPYRVVSELGSGGMGKVYLAEAVADGARVAVKVVHPHLLESPGFFKRFLREAEIGQRVQHDNVVRTLDVDAIVVDGKQLNFIVMEYVEGQTLRQLLDEIGRAPEELCRHIGREIGAALEAIHGAGVVHRDLKPENVLITKDHVVKVMDLGVARLADAALRLSQTGAFLGSVYYAAPEQFRFDEEADHRADFYSLGLMLYELATGRHPSAADDFAGIMSRRLNERPRDAGEHNPQLSPFFEEVLKALLEPDVDDRLAFMPDGEESDWWRQRAEAIRQETRRPLRRIRIPRETALYGREADLDRLRTLYESASAGQGRVVLIEGEAGIGKTRFVDEFVTALQRDGEDVNFLFGSYPPGGAATAAGAFSTAYREHFGGDSLDRSLADYLPVTPTLVPAFAALLRGDSAGPGIEPLNRDSTQTVFVHTTRSLARERTTIVLIEDLHFAPKAGLALFAALAHAVPDHRILLIGTSRPGTADDWRSDIDRLAHTSTVPLARLTPKDLERLLVDVFGSDRLAAELGWQIATKSDGNPYFVFEIVRDLRESGLISQREDGSWIKTQEIRGIKVPSSVTDLIQARIGALEESEREALDVGACCGYTFDPGLVAEVIGAERIPMLRGLARIEQEHRLVRSAGRGFVFDHHQVQEALYANLPEMLREEYHRALGEALERRAPEPTGHDAVSLCDHYLKGGAVPRAFPHLKAALDHLETGSLVAAAAALAERALANAGLQGTLRAEILLRSSRWIELLGRSEQAHDMALESEQIARDTGDRGLLARTRRVVGKLRRRVGEIDESIEILLEARELARQVGSKKEEARTEGALGLSLSDVGRYEDALAAHERDRELQCEIGNARGEIVATGNMAFSFHELARYDEALDYLGRALDLARANNRKFDESILVGNRGLMYFELGRYTEALVDFEHHLETTRGAGVRRAEAIARENLGTYACAVGQLDDARVQLEHALALLREIADRRIESYSLLGLGAIAEAEGNPDAAVGHYRDALALRRELRYRGGIPTCLIKLARVDPDSAREGLAEAYELATELGMAGPAALAAACGALEPTAAAALLADNANVGEQMETRFALWRATNDRTHLDEAHRLLEHLRDHAPADVRESMIENVPLNREIMDAWTSD